jgi:hypothetical protein
VLVMQTINKIESRAKKKGRRSLAGPDVACVLAGVRIRTRT